MRARKRTSGVTLIEVGLMLLSLLVVAVVVFPVFAQPRMTFRRTSCLSNVKQLTLVNLLYSDDNDDHLPFASKWMDLTRKYAHSDRIYRDQSAELPVGQFGYAFRKSASGVAQKSIHKVDQFILVFDSRDTSWNANGGLELLSGFSRHEGHNSVGFADGHAKVLVGDYFLQALRDDKTAGPK